MLLNTNRSDNEVFYGRAYADGSLSFNGPVDDAVMTVSATSRPGTEIFIASEANQNTASEYTFIRFRKPEIDSIQQEIEQRNASNLTMRFDLDINSNANVHMSFDSEGYNSLRGNGFGNLQINLDTQDLFEMFGVYQINQGAYVIDFQDILQREFAIRPGGVIQWSGDPLEARLDIDAVYSLNADTRALVNSSDFGGGRSTKVQTDIIVNLSETLADPQFNYQIDIASANTGSAISEQLRLINNNESLLETQLFTLLVMEQFANNNSNPFAAEQDIGNVAFNSITSIFTRQLTNLLGEVDALKNTNIGIAYENYRQSLQDDPSEIPGDLDQQLRFKLSQKIAEGVRLRAGSDFNFGKNLNTDEIGVVSVGDVFMDIDFNQNGKFDITLFSKIDYNILTSDYDRRMGATYIFEKQFDSFKNLFRKKDETDSDDGTKEEDNDLQEIDEDSQR